MKTEGNVNNCDDKSYFCKNLLFYWFERAFENELKPFLEEILLPTTQMILIKELYKFPKQPAVT